MRISAIAAAIALPVTIGAGPADADWLVAPWRPAIDAIGNAEPPAIEGVAGIPDGADFRPASPSSRGRVTIDDSTTPPQATLHLRRRKIWVIAK